VLRRGVVRCKTEHIVTALNYFALQIASKFIQDLENLSKTGNVHNLLSNLLVLQL
jgi:hypothetical protein